MAVVTLKYIRNKEEIKANLRYFTHRKGKEREKTTRTIFTNKGLSLWLRQCPHVVTNRPLCVAFSTHKMLTAPEAEG
jgi:hypothetical protein